MFTPVWAEGARSVSLAASTRSWAWKEVSLFTPHKNGSGTQEGGGKKKHWEHRVWNPVRLDGDHCSSCGGTLETRSLRIWVHAADFSTSPNAEESVGRFRMQHQTKQRFDLAGPERGRSTSEPNWSARKSGRWLIRFVVLINLIIPCQA